MILIKSDEEIAIMAEGGRRHAEILALVAARAVPGVSTAELDRYAEELVLAGGDQPAFKGYTPSGVSKPYPATLCTSVNHVVVHGIPSPDHILKDGDIISIDLGLRHRGLFTDAAITIPVGNVDQKTLDLISVTRESLEVGIAAARVGNTVGDIGHAIESFIAKRYGIVKGLAGHGVGRRIHEDPFVPNYGKAGTGEKLIPGMTLAIEPMLTLGKHAVDFLSDEYTVQTRDKSLAAHAEHTIAITENGPIILTTM